MVFASSGKDHSGIIFYIYSQSILMAKLGCPCGGRIVDQADNLPNKGFILPDKKFDEVSNIFNNVVDSLAQANLLDQKLAWIKEQFGESYPTNLPDSSMIWDSLSSKLLTFQQYIYQCESCGRIAIQIGKTNQYQFFVPETKGPRLILDETDSEQIGSSE